MLDLRAARLGAVPEANAQRADEVEELLRQVLAGNPAADRQIHALTEALQQRGNTVCNQWVDNCGGGAQGPGATVTVNHHLPGAPNRVTSWNARYPRSPDGVPASSSSISTGR
ncbi:hypothetical protein [Streptomyces parvus]|uniref:hypothetical protein n=1 Tax=Streptomyces parvus TaxID=66428 RepID=UPI0033CE1B2A